MHPRHAYFPLIIAGLLLVPGCGGTDGGDSDGSGGGTSVVVENPLTDPESGPPAGNLDGTCDIPAEAGLADVSTPTTVIGDGTPESCTGAAVVAAVAGGGAITFNCGPEPVTITLSETAKVFNDKGPEIVIDGGGLVTLSGAGAHRILYMNTCDEAQVWTTDHCDNQELPHLTVQNLTFVDGNATENGVDLEGGGGAIWSRGGRLKIINSRFFNNVCAEEGQDVGGGAVRAFDQFDGQPVYVVNTTFGGSAELGNSCSNGGGISSIGTSWNIYNSLFSFNHATGHGGNPLAPGTLGGGSGGGIYNDGNTMTLSLCGTTIENNVVVEHGSAIFFVSNDHSGNIVIEQSTIQNNEGGTWYALPGISMHEDTDVSVDAESIVK